MYIKHKSPIFLKYRANMECYKKNNNNNQKSEKQLVIIINNRI